MTALIKYDAARRALAEAKAVDEVAAIQNVAAAMQAYARQAKDRGLEADAAEIRFRAERRLGEMMSASVKHGGDRKSKVIEKPLITLAEAGVDKNLANAARKAAAIPDDEVENVVAEVRDAVMSASARVVNAHDKQARRQKQRAAYAAGTHAPANLADFPAASVEVIYADIPWPFETWSDKGQDRAPLYPTLQLPEILVMGAEVERIAARDCVLLLWTTWPMMPQALKVIAGWGFEYSTCAFLWAKPDFIGTGYWTRANTEPCLLGVRGSPERVNKKVSQFIYESPREHSRKPEETYSRIEKLFQGPYLELFARPKFNRIGWSTWGNEE